MHDIKLALPDVSCRNSYQHCGQHDQYCRLQPKALGKRFVEDLHVHRCHLPSGLETP
jgi:hypothetical protein